MNLRKASRRATFSILITGIILVICVPVYFVISMSFMSKHEVMKFPLPLCPQYSYNFKFQKNKSDIPTLYMYNSSNKRYESLITSKDAKRIQSYMSKELSVNIPADKLESYMKNLNKSKSVEFTKNKSLSYNYKMFFVVAGNALKALMISIKVALFTIFISLSIGGLAGYAFARYYFAGKDAAKISVLFVRMFPAVSIAVPMVYILASMGLWDKPLGLALVYSVGNIALTIWITSSIFISIPVDMEEAAKVFGASAFKTFIKVTLPLAMPGLAACSMYCFLGAWNETVSALILTQNNPTFAVVVYNNVVSISSQANFGFVAAGGILQAIPVVIFTFIIKKYINQMWGGAKA
jgi:multiple sugar transport system permease protein